MADCGEYKVFYAVFTKKYLGKNQQYMPTALTKYDTVELRQCSRHILLILAEEFLRKVGVEYFVFATICHSHGVFSVIGIARY